MISPLNLFSCCNDGLSLLLIFFMAQWVDDASIEAASDGDDGDDECIPYIEICFKMNPCPSRVHPVDDLNSIYYPLDKG